MYPESSAEAFEAVCKTAFPLETDLRQLQDGTLVPLHDETADRTMPGLTGGPPDNPGPLESGRHPASSGRREGTPTTWEAMLDSYSGKNVLVPELKDPGIDVAAFAASILRRGVQEKVIVQTFSFSTAQALARAGLQVLYLLPAGDEPVPASITASGIGFVGAAQGISAGYLRKLKDSGLTVWAYTVNDAATAVRLRAAARMESSPTPPGSSRSSWPASPA